MVRDSGNPASLYALRLREGAVPIVREVKVVGARNRDWEDVVYARTGGASWLYVVDSGQSGRDRHIYQVPEPDPEGPRRVSWFRRYRYAYPKNTHYNTEAALFHAGHLFLVTKTTPARLYRFDHPLSAERLNRPRFVGTLPGSANVSVARVSPDGRFLITANHQRAFVYRAQPGFGPLARFTSRSPVRQTWVSPGDNVEAGDFFPAGGCDLVLIAESRNVYRVSAHRPNVITAEHPGSGRAGNRSAP